MLFINEYTIIIIWIIFLEKSIMTFHMWNTSEIEECISVNNCSSITEIILWKTGLI